jgi:hypothetical protein
MMRPLCLAAAVLVAGCSIQDSRTADAARTKLLGMKEVDLEACLGVPDQHNSYGKTDILTWYSTSTSSSSFSIPVFGGFGFSNGGYCHVTVRLEDGRSTEVRYTGETQAFAAPAAYCAPIVRSCIAHPEPPTPDTPP